MDEYSIRDTAAYNLLCNLYYTTFKLDIAYTTGGYMGDYYKRIIEMEVGWLNNKDLYFDIGDIDEFH